MKRRAEEIYTSYKKSLSEDYSLSSLAPCLEKTSRFKGRKEVGDKLPLMTEIASKSEVWGMVLAVPALASLLYLVLPLDAIFDFIPFLGLIDDAFVLSLAFSEIRKTMGSYSEGDLDLIYSSLPLSLQREFLSLKEETRVAPLERKIPRKLASVAIRSAFTVIVVRKILRSLFSFSLFLLSLFFCLLSRRLGKGMLILSSFFMVLSYYFLLRSIYLMALRLKAFFIGYRKGGVEEGICAFILKGYSSDPSLKGILVKFGVEEVIRQRENLDQIVLSFRKEIIHAALSFLLVVVAFFLLKRAALFMMGESSTWKIIFAPIVMLLEEW